MAPIGLENSIDVASLAGTWMGTVFTGVGLLAVLTQLNSLLSYLKAGNRQWKESSAGNQWARFIRIKHLPQNGIQEGVVPIFSGWLQYCYVREKTIMVSQDSRGSFGKSSWSDLFARMDIKAEDVEGYGGKDRQETPKWKNGNGRNLWIRPLRLNLGDALVENESIMYGFSAAEFAALIILGGFTPKNFGPKRSNHSASFFGHMRVAEYNQFSHVAKFDSHHGFRDSPKSGDANMCYIPIAQSLDLAFGLIHVKGRGQRALVVPSESTASLGSWGAYASSNQLGNIRYAFEHFIGVSVLAAADYSQRNDAFETDDIRVLKSLMSSTELVLETQLPEDDLGTRAREVLNATHAIAAIHPWALLPVLPSHLVSAIRLILDPFFLERADTIVVLQRELKMVSDKTNRKGGMNGANLSRHLNRVVGDKKGFFGNDCFYALTYYEAMSLVFRHQNIDMDDVRILFAAAVGRKFFWDKSFPSPNTEVDERVESFEENMRQYLERCYLQADKTRPPRKVPKWAVDVYGNYLWGWVTDSIPGDPYLIDHFRRRVFLA